MIDICHHRELLLMLLPLIVNMMLMMMVTMTVEVMETAAVGDVY